MLDAVAEGSILPKYEIKAKPRTHLGLASLV
jgi:hypothetical protein